MYEHESETLDCKRAETDVNLQCICIVLHKLTVLYSISTWIKLNKEGKDATLCSSYRPIAPMNAYVKIFSKILATMMKNLMSEWVHADQVGFIPVRWKLSGRKSPVLLLSIKVEKAFDRIDWIFVINVRSTGYWHQDDSID